MKTHAQRERRRRFKASRKLRHALGDVSRCDSFPCKFRDPKTDAMVKHCTCFLQYHTGMGVHFYTERVEYRARSIGHHAGRLFALREAHYDAEQRKLANRSKMSISIGDLKAKIATLAPLRNTGPTRDSIKGMIAKFIESTLAFPTLELLDLPGLKPGKLADFRGVFTADTFKSSMIFRPGELDITYRPPAHEFFDFLEIEHAIYSTEGNGAKFVPLMNAEGLKHVTTPHVPELDASARVVITWNRNSRFRATINNHWSQGTYHAHTMKGINRKLRKWARQNRLSNLCRIYGQRVDRIIIDDVVDSLRLHPDAYDIPKD